MLNAIGPDVEPLTFHLADSSHDAAIIVQASVGSVVARVSGQLAFGSRQRPAGNTVSGQPTTSSQTEEMVNTKKASNAFKKPVLVDAPVLGGCMFKEPMAISKLGGPKNEYTRLRKKEQWLSRAISDRHPGTSPLSRTKILKRFAESLQKGPEQTVVAGDKMQALTAALNSTQKESASAAAAQKTNKWENGK